VKKTDATILGHHIGSLRCIAGSAWAVVIYDNGCSVPFAVRPVTWIGDYQRTICDDIPISPEVIDVHTLNFKPNFKFSRLKFFWGTPVPVGVFAIYLGQSLLTKTIDYWLPANRSTGRLGGVVVMGCRTLWSIDREFLPFVVRVRHVVLTPSFKLLSFFTFIFAVLWSKKVKERIAVNGFPSHSYWTSHAIWDHTVLPATRHKWTRPALIPAG